MNCWANAWAASMLQKNDRFKAWHLNSGKALSYVRIGTRNLDGSHNLLELRDNLTKSTIAVGAEWTPSEHQLGELVNQSSDTGNTAEKGRNLGDESVDLITGGHFTDLQKNSEFQIFELFDDQFTHSSSDFCCF
jgi:hypothetical protein